MATTFHFGNPNLFTQGIVEQTFYDPTTGNVIGYDKVGNEAAINYTFELSELDGGFNNMLVGVIPHTTRLSGTYTSQAFSLEQRALLTGGALTYNAPAHICETITATATTLTVTKTPVKSPLQVEAEETYGWCQVREHGARGYEGKNRHLNLNTKVVEDFNAVVGAKYDVFYFTDVASARKLDMPQSANPSAVSVEQKWGVYAAQNNQRSGGTLQGFLYAYVPVAILEGDAGIDGNQTTNAKTNYNWRAISPEDTMPNCNDCDGVGGNYAYFVYVPCGNAAQAVKALAVVGGAVTVAVGQQVQIPVKYVMPDDTLVQPIYNELTYTSTPTSKATVSNSGVVTGVAAGSAEVEIAMDELKTYCNVTVTA